MEDDNRKGVVVKGPWKQQSKKKVKIPKDPITTQIQEDLLFAEDLTEHLMVQLIHTMGENNFDLKDAAFIRDIGFISECCKSIIFRDIGLKHPLGLIKKQLHAKTKGNYIKYKKEELIRMLGKDDGKEKV